MKQTTRREFLATTAGGMGLAMARPLDSLAVASSIVQDGGECDLHRYTTSELQKLVSSLSRNADLYYQTDGDDYLRAATVWDPTYQGMPPCVVLPGETEDIARIIDWCRERDIHPRIRNGGHGFAGYSTGNTLNINLRNMNSVELQSDNTVRVGCGADLGEVYCALYDNPGDRRTVPGGTCPRVGVSGITAVGGHGLLTRKYGFLIDSLEEATIALADGTLVTANSENEYSDLFWGIRGVGNASLGVIAGLVFRTQPFGEQWAFKVRWSGDDFVQVFTDWQAWSLNTPDEITSSVLFQTEETELYCSVQGTVVGTEDDALAQLSSLKAAVSVPSIGTNQPANRNTPNCPPPEDYDLQPGKRKSALSTGTIDSTGIEAMFQAWKDRLDDPILTATAAPVIFESWGGQSSAPAADATAFVHRDVKVSAQFITIWDQDNEEQSTANRQWIDQMYDSVRPSFDRGCYQGYWDRDVADWQQAYYGSNWNRLKDVKAKYDPGNFFRFPQSVPVD
ncbi:MAG: FAD-binding oxidoreductase [Planctomycetota bacterium]|nr:FAD-binding oxidoreductase [Planctomycetota bacterium]